MLGSAEEGKIKRTGISVGLFEPRYGGAMNPKHLKSGFGILLPAAAGKGR